MRAKVCGVCGVSGRRGRTHLRVGAARELESHRQAGPCDAVHVCGGHRQPVHLCAAARLLPAPWVARFTMAVIMSAREPCSRIDATRHDNQVRGLPCVYVWCTYMRYIKALFTVK